MTRPPSTGADQPVDLVALDLSLELTSEELTGCTALGTYSPGGSCLSCPVSTGATFGCL